MFDQAASLRKRMETREKEKSTRIIAIASGKGGVGKTNTAVNLGLTLQKNDKRVLLLDADLGMANIDVLLGLTSKYNLGHVLYGMCSLDEALVRGPDGLEILPGTSGVEELLNVSSRQVQKLMGISSQMGTRYDIILIDIGAGVHTSNINFISVCDEVIIVLIPEPTAITDAYSLIKILYNNQFDGKIGLIINQIDSRKEGRSVAERMKKVIGDYLEIDVEIIGLIPFDNHVRQAVKKQNALLELYPRSKSGQAFFEAGNYLLNMGEKDKDSRGMEGFMSRLLNLFK